MAEKQLIVVVEGTAALGPYWQTILSGYLEKIIRCFCGNELTGQNLSGATPELAMVVFCAHGPCSDFLVQRSGWTKDLDVFFQWLSGISFSGGGFSDVAIAEGLSEALVMFPITTNGSQPHQKFDTQKHCILIAASNPHSVPTPVYRPLIPSLEHNEKVEAQPETCLADAEAVAKSLGQCSVSLSVISPKPLLKLRGIYNAGKRISRAADPVVDHSKNPHFLVLLSENFMEARAALSHPLAGNMTSNQNNIKVDTTSSGNLIPGSTSASMSTVNGSVVSRQAGSMGNISTSTVKVEPTILPSLGSGPAFSHMPPISVVSSQGVPSLQSSSPPPTSQDMNATSEGMQEMKPSVNTFSHSLRPIGPAAANVNILNHLSQHRQMMNSASIAGATSIGLQTMAGTPMTMHMSNMISTGLASSAVSGITSVSGSTMLMGNAHVVQNGTLGSFTSAASSLSGNSNIGIPPAMANLQGNSGMGQSVPGMTQGSLASGAQIAQGGIGMNQNIMNSIGPGGISSGLGLMMPMPGMSQQAGLNSLGMTSNSTMNMPLTQHGPGQQNQSKYVKIWEGPLSGQRQGQPVFICKLEGYRSITASETIAADWPQSMQIVRLIAQDLMNNKQYVGKADYLVFRTLNTHGFLVQLQEQKLCAVIQLPSQTLLLSVSDKAGRLIGMLFPGDMVVFKPQATSQQQQQMVLGSGMNHQQQQSIGMGQQPQQMVGPGMQQQMVLGSGMNQQQQQHMGMGQQPQQMVGPGMSQQQQQMSQTYVQGPGRSQGKMSSQGPGSNMSSGRFLPDGHH